MENGPSFAFASVSTCDSGHALVEINRTKRQENACYFQAVLDETISEVITTCNTENNDNRICGVERWVPDNSLLAKPTRLCVSRNSCYRLIVLYLYERGVSFRASYDGEVSFHQDDNGSGYIRGTTSAPKSIMFGDSCETEESASNVEIFHRYSGSFQLEDDDVSESLQLQYKTFHAQDPSVDSSNSSIQESATTTMFRLSYFAEPRFLLYYSKFNIPKDSCIKFDSFPCNNSTDIVESVYMEDGVIFGHLRHLPFETLTTVYAGACAKHPICEKEQAVIEVGISTNEKGFWNTRKTGWDIHIFGDRNEGRRYQTIQDYFEYELENSTKYTDFACIPRVDSCVLLYVEGDQSGFEYYAKMDDAFVNEYPGCVYDTAGNDYHRHESMTRLIDIDCPLLPAEEKRRLAALYGGLALGILSPFLLIIAWQGLKKYCK